MSPGTAQHAPGVEPPGENISRTQHARLPLLMLSCARPSQPVICHLFLPSKGYNPGAPTLGSLPCLPCTLCSGGSGTSPSTTVPSKQNCDYQGGSGWGGGGGGEHQGRVQALGTTRTSFPSACNPERLTSHSEGPPFPHMENGSDTIHNKVVASTW